MAALRYKIYSLGCKVNQYDAGRIGGLLKSAGFILEENDADLAIINTCAVTGSAITKSRQAVARARRENPRAKIVVAGCWPRTGKKDLEKAIKADLIWDKNNQEDMIKEVKVLFKNTKYQKPNTKYPQSGVCVENFGSRTDGQSRSRYFLKIQDGCEQFCSYCAIPYARGRLSSRLMADVVAEAEAAVGKGFREIVLTGIHLGLFGINNQDKQAEEKGAGLVALLGKLAGIDGLERIRLSSIEINDVNDRLVRFMAKERKMCRHLHIPLQSGCDKILRLMKRPYTMKKFIGRLMAIRRLMPDIAISTDIIVGFPGETDQDFQTTLGSAKKLKFSQLHVFPFSAHEFTPAAKLPSPVSDQVIKSRSAALRALSFVLSSNYQRRFLGQTLEVVLEHGQGRKRRGRTEYYFDILFYKKDVVRPKNLKGAKEGQLVLVKMR